MQRTAIIMAGGAGERFWPLSRKRRPKQLLRLTRPDKTMLQEAIDRVAAVIAPKDVFVITSELLQDVIRAEIQGVPPENIVAEPIKRNTAGCIALGAAFICERYAEQGIPADKISIAVLTADHNICDEDIFRRTVSTALEHAERSGDLVTLGVKPTTPATGFGYIEFAQKANAAGNAARPVIRFCEKPDLATAQAFLEAGTFLWNSGMFFWRADSVSAGLAQHLPEVGSRIDTLRQHLRNATREVCRGAVPSIRSTFEEFPDISIDYGLMERAHNVAVIPADFAWDDVGSLDALARTRPADADGNILEGNTVALDCSDSILMNSTGNELTVAAIGLENIAVVVTQDAILVCPQDRVQEVKKAVQVLRERGDERFI